MYASMIVLAQFSYSQPKYKYMLQANIIKIGLVTHLSGMELSSYQSDQSIFV